MSIYKDYTYARRQIAFARFCVAAARSHDDYSLAVYTLRDLAFTEAAGLKALAWCYAGHFSTCTKREAINFIAECQRRFPNVTTCWHCNGTTRVKHPEKPWDMPCTVCTNGYVLEQCAFNYCAGIKNSFTWEQDARCRLDRKPCGGVSCAMRQKDIEDIPNDIRDH